MDANCLIGEIPQPLCLVVRPYVRIVHCSMFIARCIVSKRPRLGINSPLHFPFHAHTHTHPKAFPSSHLTAVLLLARFYSLKLPVESTRHRPCDTETHLSTTKILVFCTTRSIHKHYSYLLPPQRQASIDYQPFTHDVHFPFPSSSLSCHPSQRVKHRTRYIHSHDLRILSLLPPV